MWGDVLNKIGYYKKRFKYTKEINVLIRLINELESENKELSNELKRYKTDWLNSEKMHFQADMEDTEFELFCANKSLGEIRAENKQLKERIAELEHKCDDCAVCTQRKCDCANIEMHAVENFVERLKEDFTKKKNKLIKEREIAVKCDDFILIEALAYRIGTLQYAIDNIDETLKELINNK